MSRQEISDDCFPDRLGCLKFGFLGQTDMLVTWRLTMHFLSLVNYVEEMLWWPMQSPNKGKKKKANG